MKKKNKEKKVKDYNPSDNMIMGVYGPPMMDVKKIVKKKILKLKNGE